MVMFLLFCGVILIVFLNVFVVLCYLLDLYKLFLCFFVCFVVVMCVVLFDILRSVWWCLRRRRSRERGERDVARRERCEYYIIDYKEYNWWLSIND